MWRDILCLSGIVTLGYGLWLKSPSLAFVVAGAAVVLVACWSELRGQRRGP